MNNVAYYIYNRLYYNMKYYNSDISNVINNDKSIKQSSKELYIKLLNQIKHLNLTDYNIVITYLNSKNLSLNTFKTYINAIIKYLTLTNQNINKYKSKLEEIRTILDSQKLNNTVSKNEFITYQELLNVLTNLETNIKNKYGNLFLNSNQFTNQSNYFKYLKEISNFMFIYLTIKYPLRLNYNNLEIKQKELKLKTKNYIVMTQSGFKFYLNDFKNIKSLGNQIIEYNDKYIVQYYNLILPKNSKYYYLKFKNKHFENFETVKNYCETISKTISKIYPDKHITNNDIRKAKATYIIQSETYKDLTNEEKKELHNSMLHSFITANINYNKIVK